MSTLVLPPVTATAAGHPCQLYRTHQPRPVRTQWHHRLPQYLQARVWGRTLLQDPPTVRHSTSMLWLCGTCHDGVHEEISWLLREARQPDPTPGTGMRREAQHAVALYRMAQDGWLP